MSEHPDVLQREAATTIDVHLINRVAGGERDAIAELYDRHGARVYALAHPILGNSTDAFPERGPANHLPLTTNHLPTPPVHRKSIGPRP